MLHIFLSFQIKKISRYFKTRTLAKAITSLLFLGVLLFLATGIYFFFFAAFRYITFAVDEELKLPITLFIYENFLLIISLITIFSSLIFGIFHLFRSKTDNWVIASPGFTLFPHFVFLQNGVSSAWPIFIIFLPGILSLITFFHLPLLGLLLIALATPLLLITLVSLTLTFLILLSSLYYHISKKIKGVFFSFRGFIILLFAITIVSVFSLWRVLKNIDLVSLFKAEDTSRVISLSEIGSYFSLLPSHPFAMLLLSLQIKDRSTALSSLFTLFLLASISYLLWYKLSKYYYRIWQRFQEGSSNSLTSTRLHLRHTFLFTGGQTFALFKKEALILSRNVKGLIWFLFLFLIWLAQIGSHVILGKNIARHTPDITSSLILLESFEFIIAIYFICAFTLRFVFPSFSMERKLIWVLGSAPLNFRKLFASKYLFYITLFSIIGIFMNSVSTNILHVPADHVLLTMLLFISTIIFIVTLGLTLGAIFPSYETDDPEVISTSMPGLFFTALSLIYGALSTFVLYTGLLNKMTAPLFAFSVFTLLLSASITAVTPKLVQKYVTG